MTPGLLRLIVVLGCVYAGMAGTRTAASLLALRSDYGAAELGLLLALFSLSQVILALPAGRYIDRHGLRRSLVWAVLMSCSGTVLAAAFPIFAMLCGAALLTGAGAGCAVIALQRQAGLLTSDPPQLRKVFSWLAVGPTAANFLGSISAGLLIDHQGFRVAFAGIAVLPLVGWWLVRRMPAEKPPALTARPDVAVTGSRWDLVQDPGFRRVMLLNWLVASCWDVHAFLIPLLGHALELSASAIGAILGAFALAATAIRILMPLLARHLREPVVMASTMVVTAVLFGLYPLMQSALGMGVLSVLLGLALGAGHPMIMSAMHQITPPHRHGEALAFRLMAINGSSVVMPLLFGSVGTLVGTTAIFWSLGALTGACTHLALGLGKTPST